MQKRNKLIVVATVGVISILGIIGLYAVKHDNNNEKVLEPNGKTNMIAMYIEDDSGEYKLSSLKEFPKDGYVLNLEKSTCTNGGVLSQDSMTKAIRLNTSDISECNLYFDKELNIITVNDLIAKANPESVTNYTDGDTKEMYTFSHSATDQTEALTDYRYIGLNPNNWIRFNDENWRIIGVFTVETESGEKKQLIKIIRNDSIGDLPWDDYTDGSATNEWSSASLQKLLNGDYYNTDGSFSYTYKSSSTSTGTTKTITKGLNATARSQIENVKWYLGGESSDTGSSGSDYYAFERGIKTCATETTYCSEGRSTNITQRVGLMYLSDYMYTYANGVDEKCYTDGKSCWTNFGGSPNKGWLFNYNYSQWTQFQDGSLPNFVYEVTAAGFASKVNMNYEMHVRPAAYLKSTVDLTDGDGTKERPYIVSNTYKDSITNVYLNSWGNELSGFAGKVINSFDKENGALLFANETWGIPSGYTIDQVTAYSPSGVELATYYQRTWVEDNVWHARLSDYVFKRHLTPDLEYIGGEEILKQKNGGLKFVIIVKG